MKREVFKHSLHEFSSIEDAKFNLTKYSKMKFGSVISAKSIAYEMANVFMMEYYHVAIDTCMIIPAPGTSVPVASTIMGEHFMDRLNVLRADIGLGPVETSMIYRDLKYSNKYAEMPKEERIKLLSGDNYYINKDYIKGKNLIFVDDVTITGTHETNLIRIMNENEIYDPCFFISFAKYNGDDPSIESRLNRHWVKDHEELIIIANEEDFRPTTWFLRLFLETHEYYFNYMMNNIPKKNLEMIYQYVLRRDYHNHEEYMTNYIRLFNYVKGCANGSSLKLVRKVA